MYNFHIRKHFNEATIQAELYKRLSQMGYMVYCEFLVKYPEVIKTKKDVYTYNRRLFADLAIFRNNRLLCLIEVKKSKSDFRQDQEDKYSKCGHTYVYCYGCKGISKTVKWVNKLKKHRKKEVQEI